MVFVRRANTILFTDWNPASSWGSVSSNNAGIDQMAASIKAVGPTKIMMTLWHEPENDVSPGGDPNCPNVAYKGSAGTVAQFKAMYQYVEDRFTADGVTNVVWAVDYQNYKPFYCLDPDLYPGDSLTDWIMFNSYNHDGSTNYDNAVSGLYNILTQDSNSSHNFLSKPWGIIEWGISSDQNMTPANEITWYKNAKIALDDCTFPKLDAYIIFDEFGEGSSTGPNFRVGYDDDGTTDAAKQAAYNAFANDPKLVGNGDQTCN